MKNYLSLEFFKMKHLGIGLIAFGLLAAELLWLTFALLEGAALDVKNVSEPLWEYLLMMDLILQSLFFPIMIAVVVSRVNDIEHKGNTWKLLETSAETKGTIWCAKFVGAYSVIFTMQTGKLLYLIVLGTLLRFAEPFPIFAFVKCFIGTLTVNAAILLLQQWISIMAENQLIAITVGILGAFIGLFSNFMPAVFRYLLIWGYYINLSPAEMSMEASANGSIPVKAVSVPLFPALVAAAMGSVLYTVGKQRFLKTEG